MVVEISETTVFEEEIAGTGLLVGIYTGTKSTQNDTMILSNFETIHYVSAQITNGATAENLSVSSQTITFRSANTGTVLVFALGTSVKSIGGVT